MIAERYYNIIVDCNMFDVLPDILLEIIALFAESFDVAYFKKRACRYGLLTSPMIKVSIPYVLFNIFIQPLDITPKRLRKIQFPNPYFRTKYLVDLESVDMFINEEGQMYPASLLAWISIRVKFAGRIISTATCSTTMFVHTTNTNYACVVLYDERTVGVKEYYIVQVYSSPYSHTDVHHNNDRLTTQNVRNKCQLIYSTTITSNAVILDGVDANIYTDNY